MKTPIKTAICDLYRDIELNDEELADIHALAKEYSSQEKKEPKTGFEKIRTNSLIMIACTLVLSISIWSLSPNVDLIPNRTDAIIADVVDNHLLHKSLEYRTNSLSELNHQFSYLGFMLTRLMPAEQQGKLIGARPCFILNIPAAQLRYQKNNDNWTTVFQTRYQKDIYGEIPDIQSDKLPITKIDRGVKVSLWRENGLLFAMAQANQ
jgi:hypothetical protein